MYYIINANSQIVAADQSFLDQLGLNDITQIYQKMNQGDISLEYKDENLHLKTSNIDEVYQYNKTSLNSLLGELHIVELKESIVNESIDDKSIVDDVITEDIFDIEENVDDLSKEDLSIEEDITIDDEDFLLDGNFTLEDEISTEDKTLSLDETADDEMFDLLLTSDDNAPLISIDKEDEVESSDVKIEVESKEDEVVLDDSPIVLDVSSLSKTIGLSEDDYKSFLDEYIQTAMDLEKDIQSDDTDKQNSAIQTLQNLSNVLHIPKVNDILNKFKDKDINKDNIVKELYNVIARITVDSDNQVDVKPEEKIVTQEKVIEEPSVKADSESSSFESNIVAGHKIDLSGVKPIHFDFSMEQAANELSLPVDLIDEFVHDFIDQAHEETEKMLTAYDEGDLDRVNKIGHLLKGTSSNLRITPLADTLYKIQFCESLDELEPLIKDYWGHFLAFENHIKMRTN